jgi:hypothetical protein
MSLRMADFGTLILRVAREEGWEADAQMLIDDWNECQVTTALQNDDVSTALRNWMSNQYWKPCELTAAQINKILTTSLNFNDVQKSSWRGSSQALGIKLHRSSKSYFKLFGLTISSSHNQSMFKFDPTPEMLQDIRDIVAQEAAQDNRPAPPPQDESDDDEAALF